MTSVDVLIVGGGPAGSSCARRLVQAGVDVLVVDRAVFPRDKVCTGWITPGAVDALELDLTDYGRGRTLQPFTGFAVSRWDAAPVACNFGRPISYGIRRVELDDYLLRRSGAATRVAYDVRTLRREQGRWRVGDDVSAKVVIGAGGHDCPVARVLNPHHDRESIVAAQDVEFALSAHDAPPLATQPTLIVWPDLLGYAWIVRKGGYLNVGAGRLHDASWPSAMAAFRSTLAGRGVDVARTMHWRGHAYLLNRTSRRRVAGDDLLLVGDAAGLALAPSGEGILAAAESGLMAADAARRALDGDRSAIDAYPQRLAERFGPRAHDRGLAWPSWLGAIASGLVFQSKTLTRRLVLEHSFLHRGRPSWAAASAVGVSRGVS